MSIPLGATTCYFMCCCRFLLIVVFHYYELCTYHCCCYIVAAKIATLFSLLLLLLLLHCIIFQNGPLAAWDNVSIESLQLEEWKSDYESDSETGVRGTPLHHATLTALLYSLLCLCHRCCFYVTSPRMITHLTPELSLAPNNITCPNIMSLAPI